MRDLCEEHAELSVTPGCVHLGCSRIMCSASSSVQSRGLLFAHMKSGSHQLLACRSSVLQLVGVADLSSVLGEPPERVCPLTFFWLVTFLQ